MSDSEIIKTMRMDNVERKLDIIMSRLESLTRLEERHVATVDRLVKVEEKLERVGDEVTSNTFITGATERLGWIVVAAVVGVIAFFAKTFGG